MIRVSSIVQPEAALYGGSELKSEMNGDEVKVGIDTIMGLAIH